jgi:hypothetical protein
VPNGNYTVTPTLTDYQFQPTSRSVEVGGANVTGVDFLAIANTYSVSGTVTDSAGNRLQGVEVSDQGGAHVAVTNAAGQYQIAGLRVSATPYRFTARKEGYGLQPAVHEVIVPPDHTGVDFVAYVEMSNSFAAGLNMIGVPGTPVDRSPVSVFGNVPIFRFNPDARPPVYAAAQGDPSAELVQVKPGRGFFVRLGAATTLRVAGVPTDTAGTVSIGLSGGWNMIANPMPGPTAWSHFVPTVPGSVKPFAFIYDNASGSYLMITGAPMVGAVRTSLLPWEGAWVRALAGGTSLLVSAGSGTAADQKPQSANLQGGWAIPVVAKAAGRADLSSVAGVIPGSGDEHSVENPPSAPATVDAYFVDSAGRQWAHDIRSVDGTTSFDLVVACGLADVDVTLSLPDLSRVPADKQVLLVDTEAGRTLYVRTLPSYTYHSRGEASLRHFQLIVGPRDVGALAVTTTAAAARNGGIMLTYSVSKACAVNIEVLNLAGRSVRTLAVSKTVAGGVQTETWNLTTNSGTRVPSGTYLVQIEARAENGQRVRALAHVQVVR